MATRIYGFSITLTNTIMTSVPQRIGNYQLERQIGKGGMSEVHLGRHRSLENRLVAVKLLLSQDSEWIERFGREANITSRLRHEHIVQIFDHGYQPPFHYTIMEYVVGGALRTLLKPGQPLQTDVAIRIFRAAGTALDYAHAHGVIHRDVSPGNILVEQDTGRVLLTDFGIARESGKAGFTTISKVMGTPGYLSPEHASSATAVTHLSDIYGLGVVLYEMLTGQLPWDHYPGIPDGSGGPFTTPPALRSRGVTGLPPDVDRVLQTMLALDPAKRYPSAHAAIEDLDQVLARHNGPTQIVGAGSGPGLNMPPAQAAPSALVLAQPTEPHPVEKVLGPDLIKGPMQKARERADTLSEQRELVGLLNQWSREGFFRRKLLGRQAAFQRATSTNVYFYKLKVLYETREPAQTVEEPDHKARAVPIEKEQDRWSLALPAPKGFQEEAGATVPLPGSMRVLTCTVCNGPGRIRCPRCQGRARIEVARESPKPDPQPIKGAAGAATATATAPAAPTVIPCPECSGSGSLECERCEGAGRLMQHMTTSWRRWPSGFSANDNLPRIDERWLHRVCQPTKVYQEQLAGDVRPEWKLVPALAALVEQAQAGADANTRIALSEVSIAFIPVTEILFDLGEVPAAKAAKPPRRGKAASPRADAGLFSWHIYGFERQLPRDWRFLNWDRVMLLVFAALFVLTALVALVTLR
jgi:eukaryotic-like serine/threonine-protein kinase